MLRIVGMVVLGVILLSQIGAIVWQFETGGPDAGKIAGRIAAKAIICGVGLWWLWRGHRRESQEDRWWRTHKAEIEADAERTPGRRGPWSHDGEA